MNTDRRVKLVFTESDGLIPRLIRFFQGGGRASHVMIEVKIMGRPMYLHADLPAVKMDVGERALKSRRVVAEYYVVGDISAAVDSLGTGYDKLGLLGFLAAGIMKFFRIKRKNILASPSKVWCSEFVGVLNSNGQIPEWNGLDFELMTPKMLMETCESGQSFTRVEI